MDSPFRRIRERKLVQWTLAYLAAAWVAPLRDDPRFEALLGRLDEELGRMREAVGADTVTPPSR